VLVDWKQDKEMDWLNEAPSQALQQSLKNLDAAWARRLDSLKKLKQGRINRSQLIGEPVFKKKEKHAFAIHRGPGSYLPQCQHDRPPVLSHLNSGNGREKLLHKTPLLVRSRPVPSTKVTQPESSANVVY
jgi:transposase